MTVITLFTIRLISIPTAPPRNRSGKVGKGLSPEEWHEMLDEEEDVTVLDCRNS